MPSRAFARPQMRQRPIYRVESLWGKQRTGQTSPTRTIRKQGVAEGSITANNKRVARRPVEIRRLRESAEGRRRYRGDSRLTFRGTASGHTPTSVGDLWTSVTNIATCVRSPTSHPSQGRIAQIREYYSSDGDRRPFAIATADQADAYSQLPLLKKGVLTAAVTLNRPTEDVWGGRFPKTQLLGPTAAESRYDCSSEALVCRFLKIPCVGYYDDYGMVLPGQLFVAAVAAFECFNDCLGIILKVGKFDACRKTEFLGLTATFPSDGGLVRAEPPLATGRVRKLVKPSLQSRGAGAEPAEQMQKQG